MRAFCGWMLIGLAALAASGPELRLERTISLAGVKGRIDHLAADVGGQRLFVAALGNNSLEVVDLKSGKRERSIAGFHEPQGVTFVAGLNRIFIANGEDGKCRILDGTSFKDVGAVEFGGDADNVRYDPATRHIWVGYGSGALGEIDAATGKRLGDVKLDAHPESFQLEKNGARIFVNLPNARHIAVIDRTRHSVMAKWPVTAAAANYPMALDEADHRLFTGCRKPPRVLVYDTASGKLVTQLACVGDTDDLFYDAARKRLYVSGGEGAISVIAQRNADHYEKLETVETASGARTALFVPDLKRLYLAAPHRDGREAQIRVYAVQ